MVRRVFCLRFWNDSQHWFISYHRITAIRSIPNLQIKTIQLLKVNYYTAAMNRPHILCFILSVCSVVNCCKLSKPYEQHADLETVSVSRMSLLPVTAPPPQLTVLFHGLN